MINSKSIILKVFFIIELFVSVSTFYPHMFNVPEDKSFIGVQLESSIEGERTYLESQSVKLEKGVYEIEVDYE